MLSSEAKALTSIDFPVPEGPVIRTRLRGRTPIAVNCFIAEGDKLAIFLSSFFAQLKPPIFSKLTLYLESSSLESCELP